MKHEPYEVHVPPPTTVFELKASGVTIGNVEVKNNIAYVYLLQQRIFIDDMIEGVTEYLQNFKGFKVEYVIYDPDYNRFEFHSE